MKPRSGAPIGASGLPTPSSSAPDSAAARKPSGSGTPRSGATSHSARSAVRRSPTGSSTLPVLPLRCSVEEPSDGFLPVLPAMPTLTRHQSLRRHSGLCSMPTPWTRPGGRVKETSEVSPNLTRMPVGTAAARNPQPRLKRFHTAPMIATGAARLDSRTPPPMPSKTIAMTTAATMTTTIKTAHRVMTERRIEPTRIAGLTVYSECSWRPPASRSGGALMASSKPRGAGLRSRSARPSRPGPSASSAPVRGAPGREQVVSVCPAGGAPASSAAQTWTAEAPAVEAASAAAPAPAARSRMRSRRASSRAVVR